MKAGKAARAAGVSADTLRHYEARGLLKARRAPNGYREFSDESVARARLIRRAVALGFTLDELGRILSVRDRGGAPCRNVRALAAGKLTQLEDRLRQVTEARDLLRSVLRRWDDTLASADEGERVGLLEALEGLVAEGAPSPLLPAALRRR